MVALDLVRSSNAQLRELGPGLVALFVGGTSGIGEFTLKAFVQNAVSPRVYLVGRNTSAADRIIKECGEANKDAKVEFIKADVTEISEVDRVCAEIQKKEKKVNLLVQTQGNLNMRGRDESSEGIDRKMSLNFYSRARFALNLLPLLTAASTSSPNLSRSLSILGAGHEKAIDLNNLELKTGFSGSKCANHTILCNDFFTEEIASRNPGTSFLHLSPGVVNTGAARELPAWARGALFVFKPLLLMFMTGQQETGERQLFHATSGLYAPLKPVGTFGAGVPLPKGLEVGTGSTGIKGTGSYFVDWNGEITANSKLLKDYRENGIVKAVWEHTNSVLGRVEKANREKVVAGSA